MAHNNAGNKAARKKLLADVCNNLNLFSLIIRIRNLEDAGSGRILTLRVTMGRGFGLRPAARRFPFKHLPRPAIFARGAQQHQ